MSRLWGSPHLRFRRSYHNFMAACSLSRTRTGARHKKNDFGHHLVSCRRRDTSKSGDQRKPPKFGWRFTRILVQNRVGLDSGPEFRVLSVTAFPWWVHLFFNATLPGYMCQASLPKTSPFHRAVPAPPYSNVCEDPSHKISRGCPWFFPPASFLCALDGPLNPQWNGGCSDGL